MNKKQVFYHNYFYWDDMEISPFYGIYNPFEYDYDGNRKPYLTFPEVLRLSEYLIKHNIDMKISFIGNMNIRVKYSNKYDMIVQPISYKKSIYYAIHTGFSWQEVNQI